MLGGVPPFMDKSGEMVDVIDSHGGSCDGINRTICHTYTLLCVIAPFSFTNATRITATFREYRDD